MKKTLVMQSCTGFIIFVVFIFKNFIFSVYIKQHPQYVNPLDGFRRGGLSKNIQTRIGFYRTSEVQFLPLDDDSDRDEFIIYQLVTDVPEAMSRLIEEKLNSSKGIQFNFFNFIV